MRRVEIAQRLAFFARAAERRGNHRRAAELFAAALQALLRRSSVTPSESALDAEGGGGEQAEASVALATGVSSAEERSGSDGKAAIAAASTKPIEGTTG